MGMNSLIIERGQAHAAPALAALSTSLILTVLPAGLCSDSVGFVRAFSPNPSAFDSSPSHRHSSA